jgi:phage-related protein
VSRWPVAARWFQSVQSQIGTFVGNPIGWLVTKGFDLINGLFNGITQRWGAVGAWLRTVRDQVVRSLGNPLNWLTDIGSQIFQGLMNGLQAKWSEIIGWIGRMAQSLPEPIRRALGLRSPSTVMMGLGSDTMAGLQIGLERGYGKVAASLTQFAGRLTSGLGQTNPALAMAGMTVPVSAGAAVIGGQGDTYDIDQHFYEADLRPSDVSGEMAWLMKTRRRS